MAGGSCQAAFLDDSKKRLDIGQPVHGHSTGFRKSLSVPASIVSQPNTFYLLRGRTPPTWQEDSMNSDRRAVLIGGLAATVAGRADSAAAEDGPVLRSGEEKRAS